MSNKFVVEYDMSLYDELQINEVETWLIDRGYVKSKTYIIMDRSLLLGSHVILVTDDDQKLEFELAFSEYFVNLKIDKFRLD